MSTSSTWVSEVVSPKFRFAVAAIASVASIYIAWLLVLVQLANWAEVHADSYPYKGGEDALRYVLPTIHAQPGQGRILLTGSSSAGEGLLYELFDRELPGLRATHGAISMARLTEIKVLLEYIEQVHGKDALPEVVVLGASTRMISNVPWDASSRAFHAIDTYSREFKVETSEEQGSRLVRKTFFEGLVSRWRLFMKAPPRFRAAMAILLLETLDRDESYLPFDDRREVRALTYAIRPSKRAGPFPEEYSRSVDFIAKVGPFDALARYLRFRFSPYLSHIHPPGSRESVIRLVSSNTMWWKDVRRWQPARDALVARELAELADYARDHGIDFFVINLPEHPDVVAVYEGDLQREYLKLLEETFGDRFLDLGGLLPIDQFADSEHLGYEGALILSKRVIAFVARHRSEAT